jgi:hypothetical protein
MKKWIIISTLAAADGPGGIGFAMAKQFVNEGAA